LQGNGLPSAGRLAPFTIGVNSPLDQNRSVY
jgi:hypothetical protein